MKTLIPILLLLFFLLPSESYAQSCCCPDCPMMPCISQGGNATCNAACFFECGPVGAGTAQATSDPACLGTDCNPLPIELAAFNLRTTDESIILIWSTETETNNEGFEVQRVSGLSMNWETLIFIPGAGTSIFTNNYQYEDRTAPPGVNYYRLKQIDFDRTESFSPVKTARLEEDSKYTLWPTLARNQVLIRLNGTHDHNNHDNNQERQIHVFDMMGSLMYKNSFVDGVSLDVSTYPPGSYIVNLSSYGIKETFRFMKAE